MTPPEQGLVAPSDIAEMAGVSRGAVSNWRKRSDDFPEQVGGTPAKPLFSREAVTAWLTGRGYKIKRDSGETHLWSALNEVRGVLPPDAMAEAVLSLACARKLSDESSDHVRPWTRIRQAFMSDGFRVVAEVRDDMATENPRWSKLVPISHALLSSRGPELFPMIDALDHISGEDLSVVADYALSRFASAQIRSGGEHGFVGSRISRLLGNLAARDASGVLYDPACGLGSAVTAAVDAGAHLTRFIGHDINQKALNMAAQRCYLRGIRGLQLRQTDVLASDANPDLRADMIVVEPPFGLRWDGPGSLVDARWEFGTPPRSSADMAWIQHAIAHLSDQGHAYVVTPMGSLFRGGSEKAIRTELVRRGCVEAIVSLPGKMLPHVSVPLAVWALCRPGAAENPDEVLFIDGSEAAAPEDKVADWLRLGSPESPDAPPRRSVPTRDILAAEADLTPQRWTDLVARDPREVAAAYVDGWTALNTSLDHVRGLHGSLHLVSNVPTAKVLTIAELVDQGVLEMKAGRPRHRDNELTSEIAKRVVTAGEVRDGTFVDFDDPVDTITHDADLTRGGDVLVTTMNKVRARVDEHGGHLPSTGVYRLRINNRDQLSPGYLALMLTGSWNERFQGGTTIQRASIRSLEVPLVSQEHQRDLQIAILAVQHVADEARALAANAQTVGTALLDAVRYDAPVPEGKIPTVGELPQDAGDTTLRSSR